jgi:heat shock protein HslJ
MKRILLSVFVILFATIVLNCASSTTQNAKPEARNHQIQREWMMIAFKNYSKPELVENKAKINLTENIENGKIRGGAFMGCNSMFFTSEFISESKNEGKVKISGIGSTMKACQNMKLEDDFSESFKKMTKYSVQGHFLTLSDGNGNQMKFIAADWD